MFEDPVGLIILLVGLAIILALLSSIVHIVREYERLVVFFFGRIQGARGPGIIFLIPFVQQAVKVDLRERFLEVPQQTCITKDNAPISIDFLVYSKVFDPQETVLAVTDFTGASQALAATTLRAVIGDIPLDDVLAKREEINNVLRTKLDEVTHRWGVKITSVEIREIVPPRDIQEAMNRQMSAERNRRAVITESEGARQSTINVAEGDKQSNILRAEGQRQAQILQAEGFSNALRTIFAAAEGIDEKTMALQYLEALKALGASSSTKWILPMELSELTRPMTDAMKLARSGGDLPGGGSTGSAVAGGSTPGSTGGAAAG
jgi:regulator of protease activity HflC (stomatin/prohibitin superfamily)